MSPKPLPSDPTRPTGFLCFGDPTRPDQARPDPRMDPTRGQLWTSHEGLDTGHRKGDVSTKSLHLRNVCDAAYLV